MNQPSYATKPCPQCGGPIAPRSAPGRLCIYKGDTDYVVPEDMIVPTCTKCGAMWLGSSQSEVLEAEFERQRAERQKNGGKGEARVDAHARPQTVMPVAIPLANIVADYEWNSRSGDYRTSDSDAEEGRGTTGIADSMKERGQDDAVNVRPHPQEKGKFLVVDGFRRHSAAKMLDKRGAQIKGLPPAHLLCLVTTMTELEARMLNLAKGGNRENLKPADQAHGIGEALRLGKTVKQIALEIGKHESYVSNLGHVANPRRFDKKLFDEWRQKGLPITVDDIQLHIFQKNVPLEKQAEIIKAVILAKQSKKEPGKHSSTTWSDTAKRHAKELGWSLGRLVHKGVWPDAVVIDWEEIVISCLSFGRHGRKSDTKQDVARPDQVAALAKFAEQAYLAGKAGQPTAWENRSDGYAVAKDRKRRAAPDTSDGKLDEKLDGENEGGGEDEESGDPGGA